jgi:hypothetical protein
MSAPTAIGPTSRTVIGGNTYPPSDSVATVLKPTPKPQWKKLIVPVGIAGAILLAMRYKGYV